MHDYLALPNQIFKSFYRLQLKHKLLGSFNKKIILKTIILNINYGSNTNAIRKKRPDKNNTGRNQKKI